MDAKKMAQYAQLDGLSLWTMFGMHRGYLGEKPGLRPQINQERRSNYDELPRQCYFLGRDDVVGVMDPHHRMAINATEFITLDWHEKLGQLDRFKAYEGPAVPERAAPSLSPAEAKAFLAVLNANKEAKPKFKLMKPIIIKKEDRPDAGRTLFYHPESNSYFIESDPDLHEQHFQHGCEDVTGLEKHEARYRATLPQHSGTPKTTFKIKKPATTRAFKLKFSSPVQQDFFEKPIKRSFILKGRGG